MVSTSVWRSGRDKKRRRFFSGNEKTVLTCIVGLNQALSWTKLQFQVENLSGSVLGCCLTASGWRPEKPGSSLQSSHKLRETLLWLAGNLGIIARTFLWIFSIFLRIKLDEILWFFHNSQLMGLGTPTKHLGTDIQKRRQKIPSASRLCPIVPALCYGGGS